MCWQRGQPEELQYRGNRERDAARCMMRTSVRSLQIQTPLSSNGPVTVIFWREVNKVFISFHPQDVEICFENGLNQHEYLRVGDRSSEQVSHPASFSYRSRAAHARLWLGRMFLIGYLSHQLFSKHLAVDSQKQTSALLQIVSTFWGGS